MCVCGWVCTCVCTVSLSDAGARGSDVDRNESRAPPPIVETCWSRRARDERMSGRKLVLLFLLTSSAYCRLIFVLFVVFVCLCFFFLRA